MTAVDFGEAFQRRGQDPSAVMDSLVQSIAKQVMSEIRSTMKPPVTNVAAPQVRVESPSVTVTPTFSPVIQVPDQEPADVTVNMDMATLANEIRALRSDVQSLGRILLMPVTKTIDRGSGGLIAKVTETR